MDDLVKRLRDAHTNSPQRIAGSNIFDEAAAALKAKDAEIARILDAFAEALAIPYWGDSQEDHMRLYGIHDAARAALQAKE